MPFISNPWIIWIFSHILFFSSSTILQTQISFGHPSDVHFESFFYLTVLCKLYCVPKVLLFHNTLFHNILSSLLSFSVGMVIKYLVQNRFPVSIIWFIKSFISCSDGHVTQGLCSYIVKLYHKTFWIFFLEIQFKVLFFELHLNFFCAVFLFWVTLIGCLLGYSCIATTKRLRRLFQRNILISFSLLFH